MAIRAKALAGPEQPAAKRYERKSLHPDVSRRGVS
jgi:hypothetical protein